MNLPTTPRILLLAVLSAACVAACDVQSFDDAAAGFGGSAPPPPPPPPPPPVGSFGPNFSEIQSNVFTPDCATSGCHSGGAPSAGLNLEAANSYAQLVGIASIQDGAILRVNAGSPNSSYLIQKLEGTAAAGNQMPPSAALPQADIDVIRQWISDGAIDDTVVPPAAPIRVTSISPAPGANLTNAPTQVVASFDREPDASTVNAMTFLLEASGGDGTFNDGNETQITAASVAVPGSNTMSAVFDLSGVALAEDTYQVALLGDGASVIMDLDANALDGEFSGALPSGNGAAGGDFVSTFSYTAPIVLGPTLAQIQAIIFTPTCATSTCHSGATPDAGLDLTDGNSFANLVNVPSTQNINFDLVEPGQPDNSYLIDKLEDTASAGNVMPPTGMLPQADIDFVRQWISDGANP